MAEVPNVDIELERALVIDAVYDFPRFMAYGVEPDDFYVERCRVLVEAAQEAWTAKSSGLEGVCRALQASGKLAQLGGVEGVTLELQTNGVADPDRLRLLRRLRGIQKAAESIGRLAARGDVHGALAGLTEAQSMTNDSGAAGRPVDAFTLGAEALQRVMDNRHGRRLVHPGFPYLAKSMGLIPSGSLVVLGGGTNVGKSGFSQEMLMAIAKGGTLAGYVSMEDPEDVLSSRFVGSVSGVSSHAISQGALERDDLIAVSNALAGVKDSYGGKLWFSFAVGGNELDVCSAMSRLAARGCRIIVVDYVQAIESSKRQQDRRNEIRWLASRLKAHAHRLDVVLVLVSQLARPPKGDEGREPSKHDLKEAGDLENAAEYVVLLWREQESDTAAVNVKLAKSKYGGVGISWRMARSAPSWRLQEIHDSIYYPPGFRR